jgi:hypothetical protein
MGTPVKQGIFARPPFYLVEAMTQNGARQIAVTIVAAIRPAIAGIGFLVNVAMMDGSVRPMTDDVDLATWQSLSTRAGNEVVALP